MVRSLLARGRRAKALRGSSICLCFSIVEACEKSPRQTSGSGRLYPAPRTLSGIGSPLTAAVVAVGPPALAQDLKIGLAAEPSAMDPHFHNLTPNNAMLSHIFERLVETDPANRLVPGLAESCKPVNDTIWEFRLRKRVKWHDGSPFTAEDVIFTFQRAADVPNSPSSFAAATKGKTLHKVDEYTLQITTPAPYPLMPNDPETPFIKAKDGRLSRIRSKTGVCA